MDVVLTRNEADSSDSDNLNSLLKVFVAVPHPGSFGFICPVSDAEKEQIGMFI